MQKLLPFFFFTITFYGVSQNTSIEISGSLSDRIGEVVNAHILNKTSKKGSFSDDEGNFSIKVSLNDEIEITSVQHHTVNITVSNDIITNRELIVQLHLKDYLLEEVEVKKTDLSGVLVSDSKNIGISDREKIMQNLGFNPHPKKISQIDRKLITASSSGAGLVSLDLVINTLSGRLKKLKEEKNVIESDQKMQFIKDTYGKMIVQEFGIDSLELSRFVYFSHFDKNFNKAYHSSELVFIEFLQQQATLFKTLKE